MMPAAKHFDPVLGIDIHIIQPPGPVPPVPIPHPFVGFLIDPMDYIPIVGSSVQVNGMHRGIAGTMGKCVPPHIPIGGVFVKPPANECEMFMGSATVEFDGDAMSYMSLPALSCHCIGMPCPPRLNPKKKGKVKSLVLPTSVVLPIKAGPEVLIGGPPTISLMAMAMKIAGAGLGRAMKRLAKSKAFKWVRSKFKRKKVKAQNTKCTRPGEPINPVSGASENEFVDYDVRNPLPFRWERNYTSNRCMQDSPLGYGFRHFFQRELQLSDMSVVYVDEEQREFPFEIDAETGHYAPHCGYRFRQIDRYSYSVSRPDHGVMFFERQSGQPTATLRRQIHAGIESRFEYNQQGWLVRIVQRSHDGLRGEQLAIDLAYDRLGHITEIYRGQFERDCERIVSYGYNDTGCLTSWCDALGNRGSYQYDARRRMTRVTDRNGYSFHYHYDAQDRCTGSEGDDGLWRVRLAYEPGCTVVTEADGGQWQFLYNELGTVTQIIDPYGGVMEREIDDQGLVVAEIDTGGRRTEWLYDANGYHTGRRDPWGNFWPPKDVLPNIPNPLAHAVPDNPRDRDWGPEVTEIPSSRIPLPAPIAEIASDWDSSSVIKNIEPNVTDRLGRLVAKLDGHDTKEVFQYDPAGNLVSYTDADGKQSRYTITSWNLRGADTNPLGQTVRYEYTSREKVSRIVDSGGNATAYSHDYRDRITSVTRHGVLRETYVYDTGDQLIEKRDATGQLLLSFEVGKNGLHSKRRMASGGEYRYAYDRFGNFIEASTDKAEIRLDRDARGRQISDLRDGQGVTHTYRGRAVDMVYFEKYFVRYRLLTNGCWCIETPGGCKHLFRRDDGGSFLKELANGSHELRRYDGRGRCIGSTVWREDAIRPWSIRYNYSLTDELRSVIDSQLGKTTYEYDAAHRLVMQRLPSGESKTVRFDVAGNLASLPNGASARYSEGNRLESTGEETFEHNHRNHIFRRRTHNAVAVTYCYDSSDMLNSIYWNDATAAWSAVYDGIGRRIRKCYNGVSSEYYWDGDRLAAERTAQGKVRLYVYPARGSLVPFMFIEYESLKAEPASGRSYYVFHNQIGMPLRIEDHSGSVVWSADHVDPYGNVHVAASSTIEYHLRFPGHYFDAETGLHYNRFRYFDPRLGRYIQSDPLGLAGGLNLYAYAPNPLLDVDVLGLTHKADVPDSSSPVPPTHERTPTPSASPPSAGKLHGKPTVINDADDAATRRSLQRENETAQTLSNKGRDVEQNPLGQNAKNPDYKIDGEFADCYSPTTSSARNIKDTISKKVNEGQAKKIVLNLDDSAVDEAALRKEIDLDRSAGQLDDLEEVIVVKNGEVRNLFP